MNNILIGFIIYMLAIWVVTKVMKMRKKDKCTFWDSAIWYTPTAHDFLVRIRGENYCMAAANAREGPLTEWFKKRFTKRKNLAKTVEYLFDPQAPDSLATGWSVLHVILYFILAYCVPIYWKLFILIGIGFEIFEWAFFNAHDVLDVAWNWFGLVLGMMMRINVGNFV